MHSNVNKLKLSFHQSHNLLLILIAIFIIIQKFIPTKLIFAFLLDYDWYCDVLIICKKKLFN